VKNKVHQLGLNVYQLGAKVAGLQQQCNAQQETIVNLKAEVEEMKLMLDECKAQKKFFDKLKA
jgi:outer membrane murein-binding lipoprotein Lpp